MPRIPRHDKPGTWSHVTNRAIARRTLFETELDIRVFLAQVARRVRAGQLEVAAFCVLTTHYHLLVRSPRGELSTAIGLVQKNYSRWFNRTRRRDGALFRGRFLSKPVDSLEYRRTLVRYIDFNPVSARLAAAPALYPHGSARRYAVARGPLWLSRSWIESEVAASAGMDTYDPADYPARFGTPPSARLQALVERRVALRRPGEDPLGELLDAAEEGVLAWMGRKAALADGVGVGTPVCSPEVVMTEIAKRRTENPDWCLHLGRKRTPAWAQLEVALLRDLAGLTWEVIGARVGVGPNGCWRMYRRHRVSMVNHSGYAGLAAELGREVVGASLRDPGASIG